jgi:hypothetical protein
MSGLAIGVPNLELGERICLVCSKTSRKHQEGRDKVMGHIFPGSSKREKGLCSLGNAPG